MRPAPAGVRLALSGGLFLCLLAASLAAADPGLSGGSPATAPPSGADGSFAPLAGRGRDLFLAKGCLTCHALSVAGDPLFAARGQQAGPDLTGLAAAAPTRRAGLSARAYVRESILEPQSFVLPGYAGSGAPDRPQMPRLAITAAEADALTAFLLTPR